ncbi:MULTISPECIES: hypothetical protein [unclassified Microcoleus]
MWRSAIVLIILALVVGIVGAIARLLPTHQWMIVARFCSRSDADGHF